MYVLTFLERGQLQFYQKRLSPKMLIFDTDKILVRHLPLAYTVCTF